jgi:exopolysaccharide biosynthesis WecB/TagA/CpsF family protein
VGAPKQEKWIHKYKAQLPNIKIFLAIGATIDFEAGNKKRAPKWVSESGLEWLHRLFSEPKRLWRRYLIGGPLFCWLVLKQKLQLTSIVSIRLLKSLPLEER